MIRCACCGHVVDDYPSAQQIVVATGMSQLEERFFNYLWAADGSWKTSFEIATEIYHDNINGGPVSAPAVLSHRRIRINNKLRKFPGLFIEGSSSGFRLVKKENSDDGRRECNSENPSTVKQQFAGSNGAR